MAPRAMNLAFGSENFKRDIIIYIDKSNLLPHRVPRLRQETPDPQIYKLQVQQGIFLLSDDMQQTRQKNEYEKEIQVGCRDNSKNVFFCLLFSLLLVRGKDRYYGSCKKKIMRTNIKEHGMEEGPGFEMTRSFQDCFCNSRSIHTFYKGLERKPRLRAVERKRKRWNKPITGKCKYGRQDARST